MAKDPSMLLLATSEAGNPVIRMGEQQFSSLQDLIEADFDTGDPEALAQLSRALNYLAHGYDYRLILDPDAYRERYNQRYEAESPEDQWQQGAPRLRDFGRAELSGIQPPCLEGGKLTMYLEDGYLGIPYRAVFRLKGHDVSLPTYEPLATSEA